MSQNERGSVEQLPLELGVAIQKRYGITLSANAEENRRHFESVRALANMIGENVKNERS